VTIFLPHALIFDVVPHEFESFRCYGTVETTQVIPHDLNPLAKKVIRTERMHLLMFLRSSVSTVSLV
jgi:hypothetical protein